MEKEPFPHPNWKTMRYWVLYFFLMLCPVCGLSQKPVAGCYSSNFAVIGWFVMHLKLNPDKTFEYHFYGDLFNDKTSGTYEVKDRFVFLTFKEDPEREIVLKDSLGNEKKTMIRLKPPGYAARPAKLKYSKKRLFIYDNDGIRKQYKNNRFDHKRKYFLKQHKEHENID